MVNTQIANMALSHLGNGKEIVSLETENSQEAASCRAFYDTALGQVLSDFPWGFANRFEVLSLVEEDPNDEWAFSYRYPVDAACLLRVSSGTRNDTRQTRIPYKVGQDDEGRLIFTDKEDAFLEYTRIETDPKFYPADFVMAFSLLLASYIAPRVTRGDPFKLQDRVMSMYQTFISRAAARSMNEQQREELPESEFIVAREGLIPGDDPWT